MARKRPAPIEASADPRQYQAEALYAESIFRDSLNQIEASIAAAERAVAIKPDYPPAVLTMGSIEYGRRRPAKGWRLFQSLLTLPDEAGKLWEVLDKAGGFLIQHRRYAEGLELFEGAVERFPERAALYQGLACCAGHLGKRDRAVAAARKAVELEPGRQALTNDLGWSLFQAGSLEEAEWVLRRAVEIDPSDSLARENLRVCLAERRRSPEAASQPGS